MLCSAQTRSFRVMDLVKIFARQGEGRMSNQTLTIDEQKLSDSWEEHLRTEFSAHSADEAIATMVANPLVNQIPVMIGGNGRQELYEFYAKHFLPQIPPDTEMVCPVI